MKIQSLSHASALSPGALFWFLPQEKCDYWIHKINWYLNFQITKSKHHTPSDLSPHLKKILKENEIEISPLKGDFQTTLFSPNHQLPCKGVIQVTNQDFTQKIGQVSLSLQASSIRVFLPEDLSETDFHKEWSLPHVEVSLVSPKSSVS